MIDDYIVPLTQSQAPDFSQLAAALLSVAVTYGIGILCAYGYNRIMVNISQGTMRNLRVELFRHMESLPIRYFDTHAHGDIMSVYTNDVDTLRQLISRSIPQLINSSVTIVTSFLSMLALNVPLTLLTLAMVGVMALVTSKIAAKSAACFAKQQRDLGAVNGYISPSVQGITRLRLRPAPCRSSRSKAKAPVRTASEGAFSQDSASFTYLDGVSGKRQMSLCLLRRFPVQPFFRLRWERFPPHADQPADPAGAKNDWFLEREVPLSGNQPFLCFLKFCHTRCVEEKAPASPVKNLRVSRPPAPVARRLRSKGYGHVAVIAGDVQGPFAS